MFKIPKFVIVLGIVIAVILAALYMIPAYDWEDGAPEATIHVEIEKTDGTTYSGEVEIGEQNIIESMTTYPLTTYTADVAPLEPLETYTIRITPTVTTTSAKPGESISTSVKIQGHNNRTMQVMNSAYVQVNYTCGNAFQNVRISTTSGVSTSGVPVAIPSTLFIGTIARYDTSNWHETQGIHIDGATFIIVITSTSADGGYGITTANLNIVVGAGGDLDVVIGDITTSVSP